MASPIQLASKETIEIVLRRHPGLHLYEIGDLDDFFWPRTTWFALSDGGDEIALLYSGPPPPVLLAFCWAPHDRMRSLLASLHPLLPGRFYAHLSDGLAEALQGRFSLKPHGVHARMVLADPKAADAVDTEKVDRLGPEDGAALRRLYGESYPGNWFDPRMLATGCYFGIREGDEIVSVAGVHVFSRRYRVAALGNVATHPLRRGRGLGSAVTAALCRALLRDVDLVGLNVRCDNTAAIRCYERLGFERVALYGEYMVAKKE